MKRILEICIVKITRACLSIWVFLCRLGLFGKNPKSRRFRFSLSVVSIALIMILSAAQMRAAAENIIPVQALNEKAPAGGDFESALHFQADFSSQPEDQEFVGVFFKPEITDWSEAKSLKAWINVEGTAPVFDGKIRAYSQAKSVDLPISVQPSDFGKWVLVEVDLQAISEDERTLLRSVDSVYVFTSRAWIGAKSALEIFVAEISLKPN